MDGVRDHNEGMPVYLEKHEYVGLSGVPYGTGRLYIDASCEGGQNGTAVDLLDLIAWLKKNRPELLE